MNAASQAALAPLSIRKIRREVTTAAARCNGLPGNAACCSDASPGPGSWWVGAWLATFAPPPPPPSLLVPRQCGRAPLKKRTSETRHSEDGERHGGRREWAPSGARVSGRLKKSVKKERFLFNVNFCQRSKAGSRRRNVKQRRRCGWDGVNSYRTVSERSCWKRRERHFSPGSSRDGWPSYLSRFEAASYGTRGPTRCGHKASPTCEIAGLGPHREIEVGGERVPGGGLTNRESRWSWSCKSLPRIFSEFLTRLESRAGGRGRKTDFSFHKQLCGIFPV